MCRCAETRGKRLRSRCFHYAVRGQDPGWSSDLVLCDTAVRTPARPFLHVTGVELPIHHHLLPRLHNSGGDPRAYVHRKVVSKLQGDDPPCTSSSCIRRTGGVQLTSPSIYIVRVYGKVLSGMDAKAVCLLRICASLARCLMNRSRQIVPDRRIWRDSLTAAVMMLITDRCCKSSI